MFDQDEGVYPRFNFLSPQISVSCKKKYSHIKKMVYISTLKIRINLILKRRRLTTTDLVKSRIYMIRKRSQKQIFLKILCRCKFELLVNKTICTLRKWYVFKP